MEVPNAILACKLLKSDIHFQLALSTTSEVTFDNMKQTLKKLFMKSDGLLLEVIIPKRMSQIWRPKLFTTDMTVGNIRIN